MVHGSALGVRRYALGLVNVATILVIFPQPVHYHQMITATEVRALLHYDTDTGIFYRKMLRGRKVDAMVPIGYKDRRGYVQIGIGQTRYWAHRLAWLYVHGYFPSVFVDHINGNPSDNRLENLRLADDRQNAWNAKKPRHNTSGFKGVSFHKPSGLWFAYVTMRNPKRTISLGYFRLKQDAADARRKRVIELHGSFARHE